MAALPLLSLQNLQVVRNGVQVLSGLNWETYPGQHWAILGANGSGKTSLLSVLCGLLTPSGGEIRLLGSVYGKEAMQPARNQVALVGSALRQMVEDAETVAEVILSGLHHQINFWGKTNPQELKKVRETAETVGCTHLLGRCWGVISQGERQKVLIARALIAKPKILILDEPCAGLDPAARERFLGQMEGILQNVSPQIIFVTHHIEEVLPEISHVLGVKTGQTLFCGETHKQLTSNNLSQLFDSTMRVKKRNGRYSLGVG